MEEEMKEGGMIKGLRREGGIDGVQASKRPPTIWDYQAVSPRQHTQNHCVVTPWFTVTHMCNCNSSYPLLMLAMYCRYMFTHSVAKKTYKLKP